MTNDISYILKRVIIGVAIFLCIMFIKNFFILDVYANQISPYNAIGYYEDINSGYASVNWDVPGDPWKSHGNGILRFSFAINKTSGSSTDPIITPRLVRAYNGNTAYVCNFGSPTTNNSTWTGQSFSVECPMNMDSNGLTEILVAFVPFSQQTSSTYRISFPPDMSFEVYENSNVQVNVDTSATTGAINNQITNDNSNTQNIINNDNQNTQQIIESNKVCSSIYIDKNSNLTIGKYLNDSGISANSNSTNFGVTEFIDISNVKDMTITATTNQNYCFYSVNTNSTSAVISCSRANSLGTVTIPTGAKFFRSTIQIYTNVPKFTLYVCKNGNQALADGQQQLNDTINDSNFDGSISDGSNFFLNFADTTNPLSDILLFPIHLLEASTNACSPITLTVLQKNIVLPCGNTIFWDKPYASDFKLWWNMFFGGFAIYILCFKLFHVISDSVDPFKDDISKVGGI